MRGLKVMIWIVILLLTLIVVKDLIPNKAIADAPLQVELVKIGGSSLVGQTLRVKVVE